MPQRRALSLNWMNPSYLGRWNPNQVSGYEKHQNLHSLLSQLAVPSSGCTRRDPLGRKGWMLWPGCGLWWQRSVGGGAPLSGKGWGIPNSGIYAALFWKQSTAVLYRSHLLRRLLARGCSRQGHCPPTGGSHRRPSGTERTGSIRLEDTRGWGTWRAHSVLGGMLGWGGGEREGRNLSVGEVCHWITKRAGGALKGGLECPLLALFLGPTSSPALGNRGRAHWRWLWINIVYPAALQGTSTEQEVETQRG